MVKYHVFVIAYNNLDDIPRAVLSAARLEREDVEVYLVDNGSDDGTEEFCEKFAAKQGFHYMRMDTHYDVATCRVKARTLGAPIGYNDVLVWLENGDYLPDGSIELLEEVYSYNFRVTTGEIFSHSSQLWYSENDMNTVLGAHNPAVIGG